MDWLIEILKSLLFGIVEGITEWLPISSTGHLILLDSLLSTNVAPDLGEIFQKEYREMFQVVIQLGAILAVLVLFFEKLNPFSRRKNEAERKSTWHTWGMILIASVPALIFGLGLDFVLEKATGKDMDGWLYNAPVVAAMLIVYGVAFLVIEKGVKRREVRVKTVEEINWRTALAIGGFQALAVIPGTSRSGSTILGSMILGLSRPAAAEFSFFMAIPAMLGASMLKALGFGKYVLGSGASVPAKAWVVLFAAMITAFAVSMIAIKFLMDFVRKHSFAPFGWYRIALGSIVFLYFAGTLIF
jgi:undecaprenyl-diphosphatase